MTTSSQTRGVLVTGATSTIGKMLIKQLLQDDSVDLVIGVGMDRGMPPDAVYQSNKFEYLQANILKPRHLANLFRSPQIKNGQIDTIVHLAFLHRPEATQKETHALNVGGTKGLLDWSIKQQSIRKFVFRSSGMVYHVHPKNAVELNETADLNLEPDCHPIIQDEVNAEMICRTRMDNGHMDIVVLRPSALVGRRVHSFFQAYIDGRVHLRVRGFNPLVNLLDVRDMEVAIRLAIQAPVRGVFNISGNETLTLSDITRLSGKRALTVPRRSVDRTNRLLLRLGLTRFDARVGVERLKYSCLLDGDKAAKTLGYRPQYRVEFSQP